MTKHITIIAMLMLCLSMSVFGQESPRKKIPYRGKMSQELTHKIIREGDKCFYKGDYRTALKYYSNSKINTFKYNGSDAFHREALIRYAVCKAHLGDYLNAARYYLSSFFYDIDNTSNPEYQVPSDMLEKATFKGRQDAAILMFGLEIMAARANGASDKADYLCDKLLSLEIKATYKPFKLGITYDHNLTRKRSLLEYLLCSHVLRFDNGNPRFDDVRMWQAEAFCKMAKSFYSSGIISMDEKFSAIAAFVEEKGDMKFLSRVYLSYVDYLYKSFQFEKAIDCANKGINLFKTYDFLGNDLGRFYLFKSCAESELSFGPESLYSGKQAINIFRNYADASNIIDALVHCYETSLKFNINTENLDWYWDEALKYEDYPNLNHTVMTYYYEIAMVRSNIRSEFQRTQHCMQKALEEFYYIKDLDQNTEDGLNAIVDYLMMDYTKKGMEWYLYIAGALPVSENYKKGYLNYPTMLDVANTYSTINADTSIRFYNLAIKKINEGYGENDDYWLFLSDKHNVYDNIKAHIGLGDVYFGKKDYFKALSVYNKVINELLPQIPSDNIYYPIVKSKMALAKSFAFHRWNTSDEYIEAFNSLKKYTTSRFGYSTHTAFEELWTNCNYTLSRILMSANRIKAPTTEYARMLYNLVLFQKNMYYLSQRSMTIAAKESPESQAVFDKILSIKRLLDNKTVKLTTRQLDSLSNEASELENQLMSNSKLCQNMNNMLMFNYDRVAKSLSEGDIAVEFAKVNLYDPVFKITHPEYCVGDYYALVLTHNSDTPKVIRLFSEDELQEFVVEDGDGNVSSFSHINSLERDMNTVSPLYASPELTDFVWGKILKEAGDNVKTIYFAPDGDFHTVGIEYFAISDKASMSDKYEMVRLTSTSSIGRYKKRELEMKSMLLYGGINYKPEDVDNFVKDTAAGEELTLLANRFAPSRGTAFRQEIPYLPGTAKEADEINSLLANNIGHINYITGDEAVEESFKINSPDAEIIHVATHGYFMDTVSNRLSSDDILKLGGLTFTGSELTRLGQEIPNSKDDGFLTGAEISELDLRKNMLLVLSACETGLGKVNSNGFFGLERAFKLAGSKTIVMSHWPVNDNASYLIMTGFYKNLLSGHNPHQALWKSMSSVRAMPEYRKAYYWAPFVIID